MGGTHGVTGRAAQITTVCYFDNGKASVLLMVRAKSAVIRAAEMSFGIETQGHFGRLVIIADLFIIGNVGCDDHFGMAMFGTTLQHVNFPLFEYDFGVDAAQTLGTEALRKVIIGIRSFRHIRDGFAVKGIFGS